MFLDVKLAIIIKSYQSGEKKIINISVFEAHASKITHS